MARILDVSNASATVVQPVKAGTLKFIQDAYKNGMNDIMAALMGFDSTVYPTQTYTVFGLTPNILGPAPATISAGAIILNGEIFEVPAASLTYTTGQVAVMNIVTAPPALPDPVTFSNQVQYNVHNIRTIVISAGASGSGNVSDFSALSYQLQSIPSILSSIVAERNRALSAEGGIQAQVTLLNPMLAAWEGLDTNSGSGTFFSYTGTGGTGGITLNSVNVSWHRLGSGSKTIIINFSFNFVWNNTGGGTVSLTYANPAGISFATGTAASVCTFLDNAGAISANLVGSVVPVVNTGINFVIYMGTGNSLVSTHTYTVSGQIIAQTT